jgi:hypothetical protein
MSVSWRLALAASVVSGATVFADTLVIPPGQEPLLVQMASGPVRALGCVLLRVDVDKTMVRLQYRCAGRVQSLRLHHPDDAAETALATTSRFAIAADGDVPRPVVDALISSIRDHESAWTWQRGTARPRPTVPPAGDTAGGPKTPDPSDTARRYRDALELYRRQRYGDALDGFLAVVRAKPGPPGVLEMIVASLARLQGDRARVDELCQLADAAPSDPLAQFMAGVAVQRYAQDGGGREAENRESYEAAIRYLSRARPTSEYGARTFLPLAVSHFQLGHQLEAQTLIEEAVRLGPDDPEVFYQRAEILQRVDVERSLQDLETYLSLSARRREQGEIIADTEETARWRLYVYFGRGGRGGIEPAGALDPAAAATVPVSGHRSSRAFAAASLAVAVLAVVITGTFRRRPRV